ncbi:hypothetical protein BCR32DRAFT_284185 [Anaeromyces robustus]|uniref:Uncharacterized protein n=1 Tax=Anaeromyces robustus TaxID=1754192 RepID=A0A1Y1WSA4_9FUNG|nr:hypothetical protein BCR32DRAFT_284185 [Anaeromyces robustus]|eukprot:ORX76420.1 hypothetical protein BCR32DRAFT_284185 [Anaeromyces robustus]
MVTSKAGPVVNRLIRSGSLGLMSANFWFVILVGTASIKCNSLELRVMKLPPPFACNFLFYTRDYRKLIKVNLIDVPISALTAVFEF